MSKILLEADKIKKAYGEKTVLNVEKLHIHDGERIALIGENGAGKSTLLSVLSGETALDAGTVRRHCRLSVIHQSGEARLDGTAYLSSALRAPSRRDGLSGGEMTRRRIAEALSENAPLLLADEPTTDLDAGGVEQLKQFLFSYRGAVLLISHDRSLLNALCTRVWHLEDGRITDFPGTYSDYQKELKRRREFQQFEYDQYRAEKARLKKMAQQKAEWAASVRKAPARMGNSEARLHTREYTNAVLKQSAAKKVVQSRMERLEKKERPRDLPDIKMALGIARPIGAKTILSARCDLLQAGPRRLLASADFTLPTGSRTALTGDNGCGKTTLLRAIRGFSPRGVEFRGKIQLNPGAELGFFDQDHARMLNMDVSALENVMEASRHPETSARTVLARLNLRGDSVFKPTRVLSGGERAKIALAKLLLSDCNLLILDEPTNHLDLFAMEALEGLLSGYGGTLLFVSHDRAFVNAVANRILKIENGGITTFEGGLEKMDAENKRGRAVKSAQMEISKLEMRLAALAARMSRPQKGDRPERLSAEFDGLSAKLRTLKEPSGR